MISRLASKTTGIDIPIEPFSCLITRHTGMQIRPQDARKLQQLIASRMRARGIAEPEQYYQLLSEETAQGQCEWEALVPSLTTGESYFFRDQGQFNLLKEVLLPELLARRRTQRTLRVWSAGCSTGEEPYSLAILLDQLLPDLSQWDVLILATDLNQEAIAQARQGVYSNWSFRSVQPEVQQQYFRQRRNGWELDGRILEMVTFRMGNLIQDAFPSTYSDMHDMDLIICRNVFIYFQREALFSVAEKFAHTLREEGYLMTGHAELLGRQPDLLQPKIYPGSVVYQRISQKKTAVRENTSSPVPTKLVLDNGENNASHPFPPKAQRGAIHSRKQNTDTEKPYATTFCTQAKTAVYETEFHLAQRFADMGQYEQAEHYCRQAMEADPFATGPYYLLAQMAEDRGDPTATKAFLKKVLYISPTAVAAYLFLASLYQREGQTARANKMRAAAIELLQQQPANAAVEQYPNLTAGDLLNQLHRSTSVAEKSVGDALFNER